MNGAEEFQEVIFAKVNAPDVVRRELARRSWGGDEVVIGTATDPYQQAESRYRITRRILEAFRDFRNPLSITTKSPMVLRDLDILSDLAQDVEVTVHFTVTTMDETLWRQIEPTTSKPHKRLAAVGRLREHGIRAGVFLSPVLPGLTDDVNHLEEVVAAAAATGVDFLSTGVLRLGPGISEYYLPFLEREHPHIVVEYEHLYRGNSVPGQYSEQVQARIDGLKRKHGIRDNVPVKRESVRVEPVQLNLFSAAG